ncbi:MAG TPA: YbjN domain-containing protein [Kofleriaceae bacterium]
MAQALFANQREANLHSTVALVEEVLGALGYPAVQSRANDAPHAWQIAKGSATARIALVDRAAFTHIRVCATVMTIDDQVDRPALFSHLLELNAGLAGAAFATDGDHVLVVYERSTLDLDRSEVQDLIVHVTTTADDHDDALVARFGGRLGAG